MLLPNSMKLPHPRMISSKIWQYYSQTQEVTMTNNAENRKKTAEYFWLMYFNEYLFHEGVISEKQRNTMRSSIQRRNPT